MNKLIKTRMRYFYVALSIWVFAFFPESGLLGQQGSENGLPFITNFSANDLNLGLSNLNAWAGIQDDRGVMYFGGGMGILEFDGSRWRRIVLPDYGTVRSLGKHPDGTIYVGGESELGYLAVDENGVTSYESLLNKVPQEFKEFDEVWQTEILGEEVFFSTNYIVFRWDGNELHPYRTGERFHVMKVVNGELYQRSWGVGMTKWVNGEFVLIPGGEIFENERVYSILPYDDDRLLFATRSDGLYLYDGENFTRFRTEADAFLDSWELYTGDVLPGDRFVFGSFGKGVIILDKDGQLLQEINGTTGLADNTVTWVLTDRDGNLWVTMFNGIARVETNSPFTYFSEISGLPGKTVFGITRYQGDILVGTNDGVYYLDRSLRKFRRLPGSDGQYFQFLNFRDRLLTTGSTHGVWEIDNLQLKPVRPSVNYDFRSGGMFISTLNPNRVFVHLPVDGGLAALLFVEDYTIGRSMWIEDGEVRNIDINNWEAVQAPDGTIWISGNPLRRMKIPEVNGRLDWSNLEIEVIDHETTGLPATNVIVVEMDQEIYFFAEDGIYRYDDAEVQFEPDSTFPMESYDFFRPGSFPEKDGLDRTWITIGKEVLVGTKTEEGSHQFESGPFKRFANRIHWNIYPEILNDGSVVGWFTGPDGILRYQGDLSESGSGQNITMIRGVTIGDEKVVYGGAGPRRDDYDLQFKDNNVRIEYAALAYEDAHSTQFQTFLEGLDDDWSRWTNSPEREYLNLSEGNYTFHVRSRSAYQTISDEAIFQFSVRPPWHRSYLAYAIYLAVGSGLIYLFLQYRTNQLRIRQKELEAKVDERTKEVQQQAEELATVNQVSQALVQQLNLEDLSKIVGEELQRVFKANIVYLALLDKKTNIINFPYQYGDLLPPLKLGEGLTSRVILERKAVLINEDMSGSHTKLGIAEVGKKAASYLGVPIRSGSEVIGVLSVQSTEQENRFGENDMRLLNTIASNVGIAIHNAQLYEEAREARDIAEEANEAKSSFLTTVSHELRTPLTSVLGFAKIIKKRLDDRVFPSLDQKDERVQKAVRQVSENLDVVVAEGERLTTLVNDVLDLAKIEAGKVEWHMEELDLEEVIERALAATSSLFGSKGLVLKKDLGKNLPKVTGDKDKLIQVVVNLLSNAVKFTDKGQVTCKSYRSDNELVVSITDTGIGIAPEDMSKVFEKFKQVGDTLTDKPKGTGLGLPICKEIVEYHGGRMWMESELNQGSIFFFSLPLTAGETSEISTLKLDELVNKLKEQLATTDVSTNGADRTILVVDDDTPIRSLLRQELSDVGYQVEEAANGREAIEMVRKNKPDLIILDVMMPEMNGYDVAAVLKNDPQTMDIPIIILSIIQDKARGYQIGVDRYLTKPIDTEKLFNEIGSLLGQGKSKKKVLVVDEDSAVTGSLIEVLNAKGYQVVEANGKELLEKAISSRPDIIILNSIFSQDSDVVKTLKFEKGMENVLFLVYQ